MTPDPTGLLVIGLIALTLIAAALACRLARPKHTDITRGFRDPYR